MKGLLVGLLVVAVLLVLADRAALLIAQNAVAAQLQESGDLSVKPSVSIRGVPFLTQALSGRYESVRVKAADVTAGGERLSVFAASLDGVEVPLSEIRAGSVDRVPVEHLSARVVLSYADLQQRLRDRRLSLSPGPDGLLRVTGSVSALGKTVSASALSSVKLSGANVVVTAQRFEVGAAPANRVLTAALGKRLDFTARIGALPYGLKLTGVRITSEGVVASATAKDTVLTR